VDDFPGALSGDEGRFVYDPWHIKTLNLISRLRVGFTYLLRLNASGKKVVYGFPIDALHVCIDVSGSRGLEVQIVSVLVNV
jgi:hypothetical protein